MKPASALYCIMIAAAISSCSDEEYNHRALMSEIVTVAESNETSTEFQFRRYNDSPLITLTAAGVKVNPELVGSRALLRYYQKEPSANNREEIEVASLSRINCDTARIADIDTVAWNATPIYLNSIWRSGEYINLHLRVVYSDTPRLFNLSVDSSTIDEPTPQLYVVHNILSAPDNYNIETYASYDISKIWNRPTCKSIDIHVNDSNLKKDIYSFSKQ